MALGLLSEGSTLRRIHLLLGSFLIFLCVGLLTGILINPSNKFESLEIKDTAVEAVDGGWLVIMHIRNTGTVDAKISHIDVNGTIISKDSGLSNAEGLVIPIQSEAEVRVKLSNPPYQRETTAKITMYATSGNQYIQLVVIPKFGF